MVCVGNMCMATLHKGDNDAIVIIIRTAADILNYLPTYLHTYLLTPCSGVLLEKQTGSQLVKKFPAFMEPKGSLPHSIPILCQLDPVHTPTFHILKIHPNIILPSTPGSPKLAMNRPPNPNIAANSPLTDIRPLLRNGAVLWWAICENLKDTLIPLECSVFSLKNIAW